MPRFFPCPNPRKLLRPEILLPAAALAIRYLLGIHDLESAIGFAGITAGLINICNDNQQRAKTTRAPSYDTSYGT